MGVIAIPCQVTGSPHVHGYGDQLVRHEIHDRRTEGCPRVVLYRKLMHALDPVVIAHVLGITRRIVPGVLGIVITICVLALFCEIGGGHSVAPATTDSSD